MALSSTSKKQYKEVGHGLKPCVTVADKGLSESVVAEINRALNDHELIKAKIAISDRNTRKTIIEEICRDCQAELIQEIGKMALLYRASNNTKLRTSNIR